MRIAAGDAGPHPVRHTFQRSASWNETIVLRVLEPVLIDSAPLVVTGLCDATASRPEATARAAPAAPRGTTNHEARFRVTATGFHVERQTAESLVETNGVGDEVKLVCWGAEFVLGEPNSATPLPIVRTLTYGDVDGSRDFSRVQAGRGNGRSRGGLTTGDAVPDATGPGSPAVSGANPIRRSSMFPIVLWEGVLRDGPGVPNNLVVLMPTLWEMDGLPENDLMPEFGTWAPRFLAAYGRQTMSESVSWGSRVWDGMTLVGNAMWGNRFGTRRLGEFSRPIGINGGFAAEPQDHVELEHPSQVYFVPAPIRLIFSSAWNAANTIVGGANQPAAGSIELFFTDGSSFQGRYRLHLRIEILPR